MCSYYLYLFSFLVHMCSYTPPEIILQIWDLKGGLLFRQPPLSQSSLSAQLSMAESFSCFQQKVRREMSNVNHELAVF